jgi:hypothetical protein
MATTSRLTILNPVVVVLWVRFGAMQAIAADDSNAIFDTPRIVTIQGYRDDAMEPFLSRDGVLLFFNNLNSPSVNTDIHYAVRLDPLTFEYKGRVAGVNTLALEGVPSVAKNGDFYFISPRDYDKTRSTIFTGQFREGQVTDIGHVKGDLSRNKSLWFNMDAEISADGETLYSTDNHKSLFGSEPDVSNLFVAHKTPAGTFMRDQRSDDIMKNINEAGALQYAAGISADELTLYFTRAHPRTQDIGIYVATRPSKGVVFGQPCRIDAIRGFVEAPTVTPDNCAIYFHKKVDGRFRIFLAQKTVCRGSQ